MPEYLAPGVYVEEVSYRARSIEGVSTTTTGFVGPTRYGALDEQPDIITSLSEFETSYGDRQKLQWGSQVVDNYLWHAVRAFFEEGGKRLYVSRIFRGFEDPTDPDPGTDDLNRPLARDGKASSAFTGTVNGAPANLTVGARFPGAAGNLTVTFTINVAQNALAQGPGNTSIVRGLLNDDIVYISDTVSPISPIVGGGKVARAWLNKDLNQWQFLDGQGNVITTLDFLQFNTNPRLSDMVRVLTLTVTILPTDRNSASWVYAALAPHQGHQTNGTPDSLFDKFAVQPASLVDARTVPIVIPDTGVTNGVDLIELLLAQNADLRGNLLNDAKKPADRSLPLLLFGGNDGQRPGVSEYEGEDLSEPPPDSLPGAKTKKIRTGLLAFEDIEDISIVAAPGCTFDYENAAYTPTAQAILGLVISHVERMRYRVAVLDCGNDQAISQIRALRGQLDSTHAALYYPWVRVVDPVTRQEMVLPPSGFVAGIYARNDINRAVYKAPANEVVNLAIGFEQLLNKSQQDVLNPEGINCFRFFQGRGYRLWGARTISSDPEWKYLNVRRYFAYLEHSIDRGTQWAVFEPNGDQLWANVRRTIEDFLLNEWQNGALLGEKPEKAYFVKCDRSTMSQNDLDNGRLVCLIGVAAIKPAEYVIFRIGQWTATART